MAFVDHIVKDYVYFLPVIGQVVNFLRFVLLVKNCFHGMHGFLKSEKHRETFITQISTC